jgi:hypothetical protein
VGLPLVQSLSAAMVWDPQHQAVPFCTPRTLTAVRHPPCSGHGDWENPRLSPPTKDVLQATREVLVNVRSHTQAAPICPLVAAPLGASGWMPETHSSAELTPHV